MAGMQIDDAQPAHPESAAAVEMKAFVIRSAVTDGIAHALHVRNPGGLATEEKTGDAAHFKTILPQPALA
jgi:hypothetical protein